MGGVAPVLIALTLIQRLRGRLGAAALRQRLGFVARPAGPPTIWLHGASNGELTSAAFVLRRLVAARPDLSVLVTANTGTAVAMVQGWGMPEVRAVLAPMDSLGAAGRVLRRWKPAALIVVENELWPVRLAAAEAARVPVALIGARMSARSAQRWARLAPGLMRAALGRLAFVSAQDAGSAARLVALGLSRDRLVPEVILKAQVALPEGASCPQVVPQVVPRDRVLLAASTHPGEEAVILQAFKAARGQFDLLILAPRHARRSAEVAGLIAGAGLGYVRRSDGAVPAAGVPVFLADTMGEMALWYAVAGATVIGGSLVPLGGHTPYEPGAAGSAILHGPHMENFAEPAAALARAGGAVAVDRASLAAALAGLDAALQADLVAAARRALPADDGLEGLVARVLALLDAGR
jgi:3-deoxy-D-manno-octulosonic-acid transferase